MPSYFRFTRKSNMNAGPVPLSEIDEKICELFGIAPHLDVHFHHWFDIIVFELAIGKSFPDIIKTRHENMAEHREDYCYYEVKLRIAEYLSQNYVFHALQGWEVSNIDEDAKRRAYIAAVAEVMNKKPWEEQKKNMKKI